MMARFLMAAVPAIGLLPLIPIGDRRESGAVASDRTGAMLSLRGGMSVNLGSSYNLGRCSGSE